MAKQLQLRRGTTSQHSTFTGANGEVTIDTDKKVVVVHDGATAGGIPLAKQATVDTKVPKVTSTDNAVVRFNGTTGDVQNSGVIIDDSGNVGIGTSSPAAQVNYKFVTLDGLSGSGVSARINGVTGLYTYSTVNDSRVSEQRNLPLVFETNNTERMRIDSAGNVGIGVTPSAWNIGGKTIEINSTGNAINSQNNQHIITTNAYYTSGFKYAGNYPATYVSQYNGTHSWHTAPSGTAGSAITWTTAMTLDAASTLNVRTAVNTGYDGFSFGTIGGIQNFHTNNTNLIALYPRNTSDTASCYYQIIGNVLKAGILANGSFQSATNSYGGTSDAKLKENVVETSDKLNKLMNVRVVNFNYIGDDQKQIGVIAQEVEKIFPAIVYETKDTKQVEVTKTKEVTDEEGNVTTEEYTETETVETGEVTKNVKYSVIYMMMLKGMQEQQAIINDLKTRIEVLESK